MSTSFEAETRYQARDHSLSMVELVWIGMLLIAMMTPLLVFLARSCQQVLFRSRQNNNDENHTTTTTISNHEALRNFMVGSAALRTNRKELLEGRKRLLESQLTTFYVKEEESSDDTVVETTTTTTIDICKLKKGDLILPASSLLSKDQDEEEPENENDDDDDTSTTSSRPICAICVSPYQVGDKICWSNNPQCHHCFHKACIQHWLLLFHRECPCCRLSFLIQDDDDNDKNGKNITDGAGHHNNFRFSREDEAAFQRMVANLRNSYGSILASPSSPSISANNNDTTTSSRQPREEEEDATTMDTSGRTRDDNRDLIHHQQQQQPDSLDNTEDDATANRSEFVDVELGIISMQNDDENNHDDHDVAVVSDPKEEETHHC